MLNVCRQQKQWKLNFQLVTEAEMNQLVAQEEKAARFAVQSHWKMLFALVFAKTAIVVV